MGNLSGKKLTRTSTAEHAKPSFKAP